jgi:hypothetical protein
MEMNNLRRDLLELSGNLPATPQHPAERPTLLGDHLDRFQALERSSAGGLAPLQIQIKNQVDFVANRRQAAGEDDGRAAARIVAGTKTRTRDESELHADFLQA